MNIIEILWHADKSKRDFYIPLTHAPDHIPPASQCLYIDSKKGVKVVRARNADAQDRLWNIETMSSLQWQLVPSSQKETMSFAELKPFLEKGAKARRLSYAKNRYLSLVNDQLVFFKGNLHTNDRMTLSDLEATDWVLITD